jgi:hypothetical protein
MKHVPISLLLIGLGMASAQAQDKGRPDPQAEDRVASYIAARVTVKADCPTLQINEPVAVIAIYANGLDPKSLSTSQLTPKVKQWIDIFGPKKMGCDGILLFFGPTGNRLPGLIGRK